MTEFDEIDSIPTAEVYAENEKGKKRDWGKFPHVIVKLEVKGFVFFQGQFLAKMKKISSRWN